MVKRKIEKNLIVENEKKLQITNNNIFFLSNKSVSISENKTYSGNIPEQAILLFISDPALASSSPILFLHLNPLLRRCGIGGRLTKN
jgi:hypothetical protein